MHSKGTLKFTYTAHIEHILGHQGWFFAQLVSLVIGHVHHITHHIWKLVCLVLWGLVAFDVIPRLLIICCDRLFILNYMNECHTNCNFGIYFNTFTIESHIWMYVRTYVIKIFVYNVVDFCECLFYVWILVISY